MCSLQSLNRKITGKHLVLTRGRYLFFNREYKAEFVDFFLSADGPRRREMAYWCREYRANQRVHLQKILFLDYGADSRLSAWFLSAYDRAVGALDVNDCYESLAANLKEWVPLLLHEEAVRIQQDVDRTFTVKTEFDGEWVDDGDRDHCSLAECGVKFGVIQRKHHCRSCGGIFCKNHAEKMVLRRNEALELEPARSVTQSPLHQDMAPDEAVYDNEREMRICPRCRETKSLFVDQPHRHRFMDCACLGWRVDRGLLLKRWHVDRAKMKHEND